LITLETENIGGLSGVRIFQFRKGVTRIDGENSSGKSSLVRGLELALAVPSPVPPHFLFEPSAAGYSKITINGKCFSCSLRRQNGQVLVETQKALDANPFTASAAVVRCNKEYLKPDAVRVLFEGLSNVSELRKAQLQAQRDLKEASASQKIYREVGRFFHGAKAEARFLRRKQSKLLRKIDPRQSDSSMPDTSSVWQELQSVDAACNKLVETAVYTNIYNLSREARRAWRTYMHARANRKLTRDSLQEGYVPPAEIREDPSYENDLEWVRKTRAEWKNVRDKFRTAKHDVKAARLELESQYQKYLKVRESFLNLASPPNSKATPQKELTAIEAKLFVLGEEIKRYDEARAAVHAAALREHEKFDEVRRLEGQIIEKLSEGRIKFNQLATDLASRALPSEFEAVRMKRDFQIVIEREGRRGHKLELRSPWLSTSEADVVAVILAASALAAYRPGFPFIVCESQGLTTANMDRLAHDLSGLVEHVIYTALPPRSGPLRVLHSR